MVEPPRPRLGGRGPALLAVAVFTAAVLAFGAGLVLLGVLPSPVPKAANAPAAPIPSPTPGPSKLPQSARFAKQGDCVLNAGTSREPDMILVTCMPDALEVLERLEGTVDIKQCEKITGYRYHYYYDSELGDKFDFVLCLRRRAG